MRFGKATFLVAACIFLVTGMALSREPGPTPGPAPGPAAPPKRTTAPEVGLIVESLFPVPPEANQVMQGGTAYRFFIVKSADTGLLAEAVAVVFSIGKQKVTVASDREGILVVPISTSGYKPNQTIPGKVDGVRVGADVVKVAKPPSFSIKVVPKEIAIAYKFGRGGKGLVMSLGATARDGLALTVLDASGGRDRNGRLLVGRQNAIGPGAGVGVGYTAEFSGVLNYGGDLSAGAEAWAMQVRQDSHLVSKPFDGTFTREDVFATILLLDTLRRICGPNLPGVEAVVDGMRAYTGAALPTKQSQAVGAAVEASASGKAHLQSCAVNIGDFRRGFTLNIADAKLLSAIGVGTERLEKLQGAYIDGVLSTNWNVLEGIQWEGQPLVPSNFRSAGQMAQSFRHEFVQDPKNPKSSRLSLLLSGEGEKFASYDEWTYTANGQEAVNALASALEQSLRGTACNLSVLRGLVSDPRRENVIQLGGQLVTNELQLAMRALASLQGVPFQYRLMRNDLITTAEQNFALGGEFGVDIGFEVGGRYARFKRYPAEEGLIFNGRVYPLASYGSDFLQGTGNGRSLAELGEDLMAGYGRATQLVGAVRNALEQSGVLVTVTPTQVTGAITVAGFNIARAEYSVSGGVTTGSGSISIPRIGVSNVTLNFTLDAQGNASGTWSGNVEIAGFGSAASSGSITNNGLIGSRQVKIGSTTANLNYTITPAGIDALWQGSATLGSYAFANARLEVHGRQITVTGDSSLAIPGISGSRNFSLYFNPQGVFFATWSGSLSLGGHSFSNATLTIPPTGQVSASGSSDTNINVPGFGALSFSLNYANNALSATGTTRVSLGTYSFDAFITMSGSGEFTLSGLNSFNVPGLGQRSFSLNYANGVLSASSSGGVSLGSYGFSSASVSMSSNGTVSVSGSQSFNVPGFGSRDFSLDYANNTLSASWSGNTNIAGFSRSAAFNIDSGGTMRWRSNTSIIIGGWTLWESNTEYEVSPSGLTSSLNVLGRTISISLDSNGNVSGSYSGSVTVGGVNISNCTLIASSNGISGSGTIGTGNRSIAAASFTVSSDGQISGSGTVTPGGNLNITANFSFGPNGNSASGSISKDASLSGALANWHFGASLGVSLSSSNNITLSASGGVTRHPKYIWPHPSAGQETGEAQNFGSGGGTVNLSNGEATVTVSALFGLASQTLTFDFW